MRRGLGTQRLLALFVAGWLLFDFPLLRIFERDATWFGLPLLPIALFVIWALLIAVLAWLMERGDADDRVDDRGGRDQPAGHGAGDDA